MIHGTENYISLIYWKYQAHRKIGHDERETRGKVTQLKVDGSVKQYFYFDNDHYERGKSLRGFILVTFSPLSKCHKSTPPSPPLPSNIKTFGARMKGLRLDPLRMEQ